MQSVGSHVLLQCEGGGQIPDSQEIRLFTKGRNEALRMPAFVRHYRQLGVQRFFFADNASTDGTLEFLSREPDVHVFRTTNSFREARGGTDWLNALLSQFGVGNWCVTVDVDELLYYPGSERHGLQELTRYFDSQAYEAMGCLLLDLYPGGPLRDSRYVAGEDLVSAAPFFDRGPYERFAFPQCPGFNASGGVRERIFYPESRARNLRRRLHVSLYHRLLLSLRACARPSRCSRTARASAPCLTKVPLVRWDKDTRYLNVNHFVSNKRVAPESGVLLHFKFLQDFHSRAAEEVKRGQYYDAQSNFAATPKSCAPIPSSPSPLKNRSASRAVIS
ncbi:MAG: glycosyltransferase family 2 protein [Pseudomonadota bacterium]